MVYSFQIFSSFIFEDHFIKPIQPDFEWLYNKMGFFFIFQKEEGLLRNWFIDFKNYFAEHNSYLFSGTLFTKFLWDQEETMSFLYEHIEFSFYWYDHVVDLYMFSNYYPTPLKEENSILLPLDSHRHFL